MRCLIVHHCSLLLLLLVEHVHLHGHLCRLLLRSLLALIKSTVTRQNMRLLAKKRCLLRGHRNQAVRRHDVAVGRVIIPCILLGSRSLGSLGGAPTLAGMDQLLEGRLLPPLPL